MEYAQFGLEIVRRENSHYEWEVCADDDIDARVAMGIKQYKKEERARVGPPRIATAITRSARNEEIAAQIGLDADEMAERLAEPDSNLGTKKRVDDAAFDSLMAQLGLTGEEARARFKGTHWLTE